MEHAVTPLEKQKILQATALAKTRALRLQWDVPLKTVSLMKIVSAMQIASIYVDVVQSKLKAHYVDLFVANSRQ